MNNELATIQSPGTEVSTGFATWSKDSPVFQQLSELATKFSQSDLVPELYKGKPQNCFIALQVAHRSGEDPFEIIQNLNVVKGNPSFKAQYLIARANRSKLFSSRMTFEDFEHPANGLTVRATITLAATGKPVSMECSMKMAREEGWTNNKKYQTMPNTMLGYRSATFLVRRYAPEIALGLMTQDEMDDIDGPAKPPTSRKGTSSAAALNAAPESEKAITKPATVVVDEGAPL